MRKAPVLTSLLIHVGAICLLLLLASIPRVSDAVKRLPDHIALFTPRPAAHQGGGGQRNPLPASRGQAPPKAMTRVFVPPMAVRLDNPKLQVQQAMLEAPEIQITAADIGDPLGKLGPPSGGLGGPNGIGDHGNGGIGNRDGPGIGSPRGMPSYSSLGITQGPKVLHQVEPEYSDEARKARYQGTVVLAIDIDVTGHVSNIRVLRGLGLGLDEKAMAAVAKWFFRPAMAGNKAVAAPAQVSVTFHLL